MLPKIYNFEQGTPEWYEVRLGKFTASTAHTIATAGAGLETLCFEKAAEILTGQLKTSYVSSDMERGTELEEMARSAYELKTSNTVVEVGFVELNERVGCSPDGLIGDDGLVEIKCPNDSNFVRFAFEGEPNPQYMYQIQMQLWVSGRKWCEFVIYNESFPNSVRIFRVDRDEEIIKKINQGVEKGIARLQEILAKFNGN